MIRASIRSETEWQYRSRNEECILNIVATLKSKEELHRFCSLGIDVFLLHTDRFTRNRDAEYSDADIPGLIRSIHSLGKKVYLLFNTIVHEDSLDSLDSFVSSLTDSMPDGIVAYDFTMYPILSKHKMEGLMIYQPGTLTTNAYDSWFLKKLGIKGMTVSKEITLSELMEITNCVEGIEYSLSGHGYLEMFYSRRPLLTNYALHRNLSTENIPKNHHFRLQEQTRPGQFYPVYEDDHGTTIYRPLKLESFNEIGLFSPFVSDFFIERAFLDNTEYEAVLNAYHQPTAQKAFLDLHGGEYDHGFYYRPVGLLKEDDNER